MSNEDIVFKWRNPTGGAYLDPDFLKSYWELVKALHELIPEERSHGSLSLGGVGSMCRARTKAIVEKAKTMENIMRAVTVGRK